MSGEDCVVCKIIRTYLLFAVPLLALVGAGAIDGDNANRWWFVHVELIDLLAWGAVVALIGITAYRAYREFYLPVRRQRALQAFKTASRILKIQTFQKLRCTRWVCESQ